MAAKRIYCLDDVSSMRVLYEHMLHLKGFAAQAFQHTSDFLRACQESPPDAAVVDVHLAGDSGLNAIQQLRKRAATRDMPLLVVSADSSQRTIDHVLRAGADEYIVKPVDIKALIARLSALLEGNRDNDWTDYALPPNTVLSERYRLTKLLKRGSHCLTYRAKDQESGDPVAIHMLEGTDKEIASSAYIKRAFEQLGHYRRLVHGTILGLRDYGQYQGTFFLVLDLPEGHSLQRVVDARGPCSSGLTVQVGLRLCDAFKHLQDLRLYIGRITPDQLMLTRQKGIVLLGCSDLVPETPEMEAQFLLDLGKLLAFAITGTAVVDNQPPKLPTNSNIAPRRLTELIDSLLHAESQASLTTCYKTLCELQDEPSALSA